MLALGQLAENSENSLREKMRFFGSLVNGDRGNILTGSLNEARVEAFWDLLEAMTPYRQITRSKLGDGKPQTNAHESSLQAGIDEYRKMVERGLA